MEDWLWNTLDYLFNPIVKGIMYAFDPVVDWIVKTDQRRMTAELAVPLFLALFLYLMIIAPYIPH